MMLLLVEMQYQISRNCNTLRQSIFWSFIMLVETLSNSHILYNRECLIKLVCWKHCLHKLCSWFVTLASCRRHLWILTELLNDDTNTVVLNRPTVFHIMHGSFT